MSEDNPLAAFMGNSLAPAEKEIRLWHMLDEIDSIDKEFIPYLKRINTLPLFVTTQCCTGHGENPREGGRRAHIDFRCALAVEETVDNVLRPVSERIGCNIELMLEVDRLRYILWLDNGNWQAEMEAIIEIMEEVEE